MQIFGKKHSQKTLRTLHDRGIEMTPTELIATRKAAFAEIRRGLRAKGCSVPDSDEELFKLMRIEMGESPSLSCIRRIQDAVEQLQAEVERLETDNSLLKNENRELAAALAGENSRIVDTDESWSSDPFQQAARDAAKLRDMVNKAKAAEAAGGE